MFHTDIEEDAGSFDLDAVADGVCKKLILRHPHVFGDAQVSDSAEVLSNWDKIKRTEKHQETYTNTLESVARSLPALWRAEKIQKKAAKVGFDWDSIYGTLDKISEEIEELREAVSLGADAEEELGDLLFAAVNAARFIKSDPEVALNAACDKFISRFAYMESAASERGLSLEEMSLQEMDKLWDEAKDALKNA